MIETQETGNALWGVCQQQQQIVVRIQEIIQAEWEAVKTGNFDALVQAASEFMQLAREYEQLDSVRQQFAFRLEEGVPAVEEEVDQGLAELRRELQQARDAAMQQHQQLRAVVQELRKQQAQVQQGKQTFRLYGGKRQIDPRCIDQYR